MITPFLIKLCLSLVVGGIWVALTTLIAERFGSKVGGLVGGLPSTALVALLFIGFFQSPEAASATTTVMPLTQGFNGLFILAFILFAHRGLIAGLSAALIVWFFLAAFLVLSGFNDFILSIAGWLLLFVVCLYIVEKKMAIPSRERMAVHYSFFQIVIRAVFAGCVIAFAVLMNRLGGSAFGGLFATFPAMFISTLIIIHRTGGADFSRAVAKSLMISGMVNVPFYAIAVRYLYPTVGLLMGTGLALLLSLMTGYVTFLLINKKIL